MCVFFIYLLHLYISHYFISLYLPIYIGIVVYYPEIPMPCNPSPCGENAICREKNGVGSCSCMPDFYGDPNIQCRPECITNNDCDTSKACVHKKCSDPCVGMCGANSVCRVINHTPRCNCIEGYTGNPQRQCYEIREFHSTNYS
jgi:hypothetical protein